jgi:hypothetical protein
MNRPDVDLSPLQRRALINGVIAAAIVLGLSVLAFAGGGGGTAAESPSPQPSGSPSAPACIPSWDLVQAADPGETSNALDGIAVLSAGEAWAVGASGEVTSPNVVLLERWDGEAWTAEEGPSPGSETNELLDVDASEPNDVWAVGRTASGFGDRPLVLHYDGSTWTVDDVPPDVSGVLTGVAAIAPNDVWVVGYEGDPAASLNQATMLHWDGELWTVVDPGKAIGNGASLLNDITALSSDDIWAVGQLHNQPLIIRYDGSAWERTPTDVHGKTNAIAPISPDEAWAVGSPIQHFQDGEWSQQANVRADGVLSSVAAVSATDVWAVGVRPGQGDVTRALVIRFDGHRWKPVDGPSVPGSDGLTGVDALPDGTVLAVGYKDVDAGRRTLAIRGTTCLSSGG